MRVIFFGTPEFAVPTLDAVAGAHQVLLVVAQPDKPAGRGMKLQPPAIAVRAREMGLPLAQPAKIRTPEFLDTVAQLRPDLGVVIAYGKILPGSLLSIPEHGFVNVHASILPKYRGAAPIQRAIEAGETTTGVTIMGVDEELDHGPILSIATTEIGADERMPSVAKRLSTLGAEALLPVVDAIANGTAVETPQDHAKATIAPKIDKQEGAIRWSESARTIFNRFRAFDPWPGVFFARGGETVKVTGCSVHPDAERSGAEGSMEQHGSSSRSAPLTPPPRFARRRGELCEPGIILQIDAHAILVATGDGDLRLTELQRAGKPRAAAADVARGLGWRAGDRLE